jgi:hypothetical protein
MKEFSTLPVDKKMVSELVITKLIRNKRYL